MGTTIDRKRVDLSTTSKLGTHSISVPAGGKYCPGSRLGNGKIAPACRICYAKGGHYHRSSVKLLRERNAKAWKRASWVDDMIKALEGETYFRWFDSGDVYSPRFAAKIAIVIERTPSVLHWLPTKCHKFPKIAAILDWIDMLPNAIVRRSSDGIFGEHEPEHGSTIVQSAALAPKEATVCRAYERGGKCGDCRACWSPDHKLIAYKAHGQSAKRVAREETAKHWEEIWS